MKKVKATALRGHKDIYDLEGNRLPRWDVMREIVKSKPGSEKEKTSAPDPIVQALISLVQELKTNSALSDENMQKLTIVISKTINQIKELAESIPKNRDPAKQWKFVATRTASGFVLDAERIK